MKERTLLVGEPMGLFIAGEEGRLCDVSQYTFALAGAEFNVAIGMERLGQQVGYYTKLGHDPFGQRIISVMNQNQISTELITFSDERPTGFMLKSKVNSGDPEIFYFRKGSAASTISEADMDVLSLESYDAVHMTGITAALTEGTQNAMFRLAQRARERRMRISFDPNLRPQLWKSREEMVDVINRLAYESDIFLPGINELKILTDIVEPEKAAQYYLDRGVKLVVIKLGADGAYYASHSESGFVKGFEVKHIVDTVGAGDGFAAGFLSGINEGLSVEQAVRQANAVGAVQLMSIGDNDGLPTAEELERFMNRDPNWR
ncbi:MAG: sugar kinase [Clostridiales bacterium]|nr:sugar kinase [Clostridiales bacterium]MDY3745675.1 sugar kinase [Lachnospiraceae bacterium]